MKLINKKLVHNAVMAIIGSVCYAIGISLFLEPNNLAPGGVSGIGIMVNYLTPLSVGFVTVALNIPLMIIGLIKLGRSFVLSTGVCVLLTSVLVDLFSLIKPITDDRLLASLAGGAILAVGLALIFKTGATTGGGDIVIRLLRLKFKHVKSGTIMFMIDGIISLLSYFVYRDINVALYAVLSLVVSSVVMDIILYGGDEAKLAFIVTEKQDEIVKNILEELDISASILDAVGAYSKQTKHIVMCATRKQLLPGLEEMVLKIDKNSFMIVTSASEIYGEGFKENMNLY
ncbi:MAG: YitT family protein [Ruminococcus sp.]|nr:YitT family protein [Ruminococcus sp.]